jgi:hypothetical protein
MFRLAVAVGLAAAVFSVGTSGQTSRVPRAFAVEARVASSALPTTLAGRYVVAGSVDATVRVGGTVYIGGDFNRIADRTGSAIVVPARGGAPERVRAEIAGGSVRTAISDGSGGWYVGGSFTSVGGARRDGLAHLSPDGTPDLAFTPPTLGEIRALALVGGILYVGGVQPFGPGPPVGPRPVLRALDAASGDPLPAIYAPLDGAQAVLALLADAGRLYIAFGQAGVGAYDAASGTRVWARRGCPCGGSDEGAGALALDGGRLLVGGEFQDRGRVNLEELDATSGRLVGRPLTVKPAVSAIAVAEGTVYITRPAASGLDIVELTTGVVRPWGTIDRPGPLAEVGSTIYVAGPTRIYSARAGTAHAVLHALSPLLAGFSGSIFALAPQGARVLVGGSFTGAGGAVRNNLAAFNARTGELRSWRPNADQYVRALAFAGHTIYVAGGFHHISGAPRDGLAAVSADGAGRLLPWRPPRAPGPGSVDALVVSDGRVFLGGGFEPSHLAAFSAAGAGSPLPFFPHVTSEVNALAVWHQTLLVGGQSVVALAVGGDGRHQLWQHPTNNIVSVFETRGTTLYAGGYFVRVSGQRHHNLAAFALNRRGALLSFAPPVPIPVESLVQFGDDLVFGGLDPNGSGQVLGAVAEDGTLETWRLYTPPGDDILWHGDIGELNADVSQIAAIPGGLFVAGNFNWLGPVGRQAAGGVVWLR